MPGKCILITMCLKLLITEEKLGAKRKRGTERSQNSRGTIYTCMYLTENGLKQALIPFK